jgi:hypothetical protein
VVWLLVFGLFVVVVLVLLFWFVGLFDDDGVFFVSLCCKACVRAGVRARTRNNSSNQQHNYTKSHHHTKHATLTA